MPRRRVVVTGMGAVSALGSDARSIFAAAFKGISAVRMVRSGTEELGADLPLAPVEFTPEPELAKGSAVFMARAAQMAVVSAGRALREADLDDPGAARSAGCFIGCSLGGSEVFQNAYRTYFEKGSRRVRPTTVPMIMASGPASHISMHFGIEGPTHSYSVACASSAVAIGEAFRAVRDGYLERAVAGGAEAMLNDGTITAWQALRVLASPQGESAAESSRPFDATRTGFVLGEGAAVFVLETLESAEARGAEPLGEVVGFGSSSDAFNLTEPSVDGQRRCLRAALGDAAIQAEQVEYVNAHGTATPTGDPVEVEAMRSVFGDDGPPLSSTKGVHGHLVGASGALEALITMEALRQGKLPPTAHLTDPDSACPWDCIPLVGREVPGIQVAMSNSFAFGGSNASLVFRRV